MKIREILFLLKEKKGYKEFKEMYPDSFLSAFFLIVSDNLKEKDQIQIDFFLPEEKKIASFDYPFDEYKVHEDKIENAREIKETCFKIDVDDLKKKIENEFNQKFNKIIAIFQDDVWNTTCFSGMIIKRIKINALTGEVIFKDDLRFADIMQFKKPFDK